MPSTQSNLSFEELLKLKGRELIKNTFSGYGPATEEELSAISNLFQLETFPRYQIIIKPGDANDKIYFTLKGMVRIYISDGQNEITNQFICEEQFFAAVFHVFTGQQNPNYYEAIEELFVLSASYREMEKTYSRYHNLERIGRKIVEHYYAIFLKQYYDLIQLSELERYRNFEVNYPKLLKRVPLREVSTLLGIPLETLNQIRSNS